MNTKNETFEQSIAVGENVNLSDFSDKIQKSFTTSKRLDVHQIVDKITDNLTKGTITGELYNPAMDMLVKAKYLRREGTPGNYKYFYADGKEAGKTATEEPKTKIAKEKAVEQKLKDAGWSDERIKAAKEELEKKHPGINTHSTMELLEEEVENGADGKADGHKVLGETLEYWKEYENADEGDVALGLSIDKFKKEIMTPILNYYSKESKISNREQLVKDGYNLYNALRRKYGKVNAGSLSAMVFQNAER